MDRRQWREPCDEHIVAEDVRIERGGLLRIRHGRELLLYVQSGAVWLTQEGDRRDIVVEPGRWFRIDSNHLVLATALREARVTLSAPLNAPAQWTIEQVSAAGRPAGLRIGMRPRVRSATRRLRAAWLRLYRKGRRAAHAHLSAATTATRLDPRTLKDIGLEAIEGGSFAERADRYRWRHDIHFGLRGNSFL